ncbi:MAG: dephospho-CoA kinase [Lishizhenia sp.]
MKQKKIGITGGIGAGKSVICSLLSVLGYPVFNSDRVAKNLMQSDLREEIILLFGEKAYLNEKLNRTYISERVFKNKTLLTQLNQIVHPAVRNAFDQFCLKSDAPLVFNEAAILFETGAYKNFDAVVLVKANQKTRIERVLKRDKISEDQIKARMNNQWSDQKKSALTSFIVENDDDKLIIPQTLRLVNHLISS